MGKLFGFKDTMLPAAIGDFLLIADLDVFEWDTVFETGIAEIDEQHKMLVQIANDVIKGKADCSKEQISSLLKRLLDYTSFHFSCEEAWMRQFGVSPKYVQHHSLVHKRFIQHVNSWVVDHAASRLDINQIINALCNWLIYHILGDDQVLTRQIKAIKAGSTPEEAYKLSDLVEDPRTNILLKTMRRLFAGMVERNEVLQSLNRQLFSLSEQLEDRVAERTQELKAAKEDAEAANRAKTVFLNNLSHEVRTPLHSIIGMSELMRHTPLAEEQKDFLVSIESNAGVLHSVIDDILSYTNNQPIRATFFDLRNTLAQTVRVLSDSASKKGLQLDVAISDKIPRFVNGDHDRLCHLLLIITENAIKFTNSGRVELDVRCSDPGPSGGCCENGCQLKFTVRDTGIGMSPETLANLFQPFYQADLSLTKNYGGTGMGLSVAKRLVEHVGGSISVSSVFGLGSEFALTIPFAVSSDQILVGETQTKSGVGA